MHSLAHLARAGGKMRWEIIVVVRRDAALQSTSTGLEAGHCGHSVLQIRHATKLSIADHLEITTAPCRRVHSASKGRVNGVGKSPLKMKRPTGQHARGESDRSRRSADSGWFWIRMCRCHEHAGLPTLPWCIERSSFYPHQYDQVR